jgi:outer membrane protein assembly factor BamB
MPSLRTAFSCALRAIANLQYVIVVGSLSACLRDSVAPSAAASETFVVRTWRTPMPLGDSREITSDAASTESTYVFVASNRGLAAVNRADGTIRWSVGGPFSSARNVRTSAGAAIVSADDSVVAFNLADGRQRWSVRTTASSANCASSSNDAIVVICTADWRVIAIDAATGAIRWSRALRDSLAGLPSVAGTVISGDTIYAAVKQVHSQANGFAIGLFFALSLEDGRILNVMRDGSYTDFSGYVGVPTVVGPQLVIPHLIENKLTAINRFTGRTSWRVVGDPGWVGFVSVPTVVDGVLYAASADRRVYAVDASSGAIKWKSDILNGSQDLAAACGSLVLTWTGLTVRVLDRETGRFRGVIDDDMPETTYAITAPMRVDGSRLFVRSQREVRQYTCK